MLLIHQLLEQPSLLAYFTGADNYAWLQFRNGERRLLAKPLVYFEERLPTFIRIHKTALINPACISSLQPPPRPKMAGSVRLVDGMELPVSRRRWPKVFQSVQTDCGLVDSTDSSSTNQSTCDMAPEKALEPFLLQTIMSGDTLLLTQHGLHELNLPCRLQSAQFGVELASAILLSAPEEWPVLILIDARTNRADRILTLQTLKGHPQLRAIPVIWLVAPGQDMMQAYLLDANSVVIVSEEPTAFVKTIKELLYYWLTIVQLYT
ncbi:LytTR family transcriptional regulator DNA-binding domain-containing protein [Spirosoma endbachense]|uniref:LytTR family transcriptional regulator n=1 Tax=Spirosoma endbachense TaxID=2666025 RepID=A0A6P1VQ04_9BACT|nr:LytTR family transcriptional regulator DNA-binding domain-containing protein [Spirosoma endbachense]QHV95341.1 LytTR family transcriptional regulator [Spirosoma endbachense]